MYQLFAFTSFNELVLSFVYGKNLLCKYCRHTVENMIKSPNNVVYQLFAFTSFNELVLSSVFVKILYVNTAEILLKI